MNKIYLPLFLVIFIGCSNATSKKSGDSASFGSVCTNCTEEHKIIQESSPTLIHNHISTLQNFRSCLGLEVIKPEAVAQYKNIKSNLSYSGESRTINNTVLMSNMKTAVVACNEFIKEEASSLIHRNLLEGFMLTANDRPAEVDPLVAAGKIAHACWGREMTENEKSILNDGLEKNFVGFTKTGKEAAFFICMSILSVPEAMKR